MLKLPGSSRHVCDGITRRKTRRFLGALAGVCFALVPSALVIADEPAPFQWKYAPELLRPFWEGDTVEGESVLFIKDPVTGEASGSLLFPPLSVSAVRNSS